MNRFARAIKVRTVLALCLLYVPLQWLAAQPASPPENLSHFPRASLEITTAHGKQTFQIWIADSPAREEQGLMFVKSLPNSQGMLFPQDEPREMTMWMKNTLISLDMLFIDADGKIVYIKHNATPLSEDIIGIPHSVVFNAQRTTLVSAVLELRGGEADRRGIAEGDSVAYAK